MPQRLCLTKDGRILVSDHTHHAILVFDLHGNYLSKFGESDLTAPMDMTELPQGQILVADAKNGLVVFNASGQILSRLEGSARGGFLFKETVDVASHDSLLFILDSQRHAVDVFQWQLSVEGSF